MAFSKKTRTAAVLAVANGMTHKEAAKKYGTSPHTIGAWVVMAKKEGRKAPATRSRRNQRQTPVARQTFDNPIAVENAKLRNLLVNAMIELVSVQNRLQ